jgi:hypothetical protein
MPPEQLGGFSIGSLRRFKTHLLDGEGPINGLLRRDDRRLLSMRLARQDGATNPCGPLPHMFADALDDRVFDSSMFHDRENPWRLDLVPSLILILRVNL